MIFKTEVIKIEVIWQLSSKTSQFNFYLNILPSLTFFKALGSLQFMHLVFFYLTQLTLYRLY